MIKYRSPQRKYRKIIRMGLDLEVEIYVAGDVMIMKNQYEQFPCMVMESRRGGDKTGNIVKGCRF